MEEQRLRKELAGILAWENAHINFKTATRNLTPENSGNDRTGLPYTIWQLVVHIQRTQRDMLDFITNQAYSAPTWPDDYWPKEKAPASVN